MLTTEFATTRVEIDLSNDVVFATKSFGQPGKVQQTIKTALAVCLFQEDAISFGKASEIVGMPQGQFRDLLQAHGIAAYGYTDEATDWDDESVAACQQAVQP